MIIPLLSYSYIFIHQLRAWNRSAQLMRKAWHARRNAGRAAISEDMMRSFILFCTCTTHTVCVGMCEGVCLWVHAYSMQY